VARSLTFPCPESALPEMAVQLRTFGAQVTFDNACQGRVDSPSGSFEFLHDQGTLHIRVLENKGHFPARLLIGGMRQFVEEAVELLSGCKQNQRGADAGRGEQRWVDRARS
jgi:hypothetical protein